LPEGLADRILGALAGQGGWEGELHLTTPGGAPLDLHCAVAAVGDGGAPRRYVAVATLPAPRG